MTDHPHHQHHRHRPPGFHDPVAVVRGLLAAAAIRVEPAGDVELEIFAAWVELEEPRRTPQQVVHHFPGDNTAEVILSSARHVLHAALLTLTAEAWVLPLVRAIVHLDAAVAHLRGEAPTHPVVS